MHAIKTTFTLPDNIVRELSEFSNELGVKKSHIVSEALSQYFDTLDLKIAQKRSQEMKDGKVKVVSLDEIRKEIGL